MTIAQVMTFFNTLITSQSRKRRVAAAGRPPQHSSGQIGDQ
jgi:hypothetical protein